MKCSEFRNKILSGIKDKDLNQHIASCADCTDFAKFADEVLAFYKDKEKVTPPTELDLTVKSYAKATLKKSRSGAYREIIAFGIAASILLCATFLLILQRTDKPNATSSQRQFHTNLEKNSELKLPNWENLDMTEDFFVLSSEIVIMKETLTYSYLDKEENYFELPELEIPIEIQI